MGGGGSGRWVNAQHSLMNLAGTPNVIFRFVFGAGSQCNAYDGFAVDDIVIGNAPPNNASFTYTCVNSNTIQFNNTSALCPASAWDFGDPASGANNTSTLTNPTHTFSGPGIYSIKLTATGPGNAPSVFIYPNDINILGVTTTVSGTSSCSGGNNGSATTNVIPAAATPFFYNWNTMPAQTTPTITGLAGGTYTVTVNANNSCTASATAVINQPAALAHSITTELPGCGLASGSATITETGGTPPYTYSWSPYGGTASTATGLIAGDYIVTVTDSKGCFENIPVKITEAPFPTISIINKKDASCFGLKDGTATAVVSGGRPPFMYSWNTIPEQKTATATNLAAGIYTVNIVDNNICIASASVQINEPANGSCGDVYFPNAFTPNGDANNPNFGVLGNVAAISNYLLLVYNRYGELIFYTRDPLKKWDGFYKSKQLSGTYVWAASFTFKGNKRDERGSVTIIR